MFMYNLAMMLKYQHNTSAEATSLFRHVHETQSKSSGLDNEVAKESMLVLADHLQDCGQHGEAELLRQQRIESDDFASIHDRSPIPRLVQPLVTVVMQSLAQQ